MAHKFRGEVQIESGLGLPQLTSAQRTAYTPPADGYVVFDTDLKHICVWDATALEWITSTSQANVDGKINVLDGISKNTLTLQDTSDVDVIKFETGVVGGSVVLGGMITSEAPNSIIFSGNDRTITADVNSYTSNNSIIHRTAGDLSMTRSSGKWYWETEAIGTSNTNQGWYVGIAVPTLFNVNNNPAEAFYLYSGGSNGGSYFAEGGFANFASSGLHIGTFRDPGAIIQHRLDLDAGTYETRHAGNVNWITRASIVYGPVSPLLGVDDLTSVRGRFAASELTLAIPTGFSTFESAEDQPTAKQDFYSGGTKVSTIEGTPDSLTLQLDGGSELQLQDTYTQTNNPIRGVDGTDPSSLITKQYIDGFVVEGVYRGDFVTGDWTAGNPNTYIVTQATHGIPHTSGKSYKVSVQELESGGYRKIELCTSTNITTGDVTIETIGAVFAGRIFISR